MQRIPREGGWIQPNILTRILVRLVNLNFSKSGEYGLFFSFFQKNREILAEAGTF